MLMTRSCLWSCYKTSKAFVAHLISIVLDFCRGFSSRTMVRSKGCGPVIGKRSKVGKFSEVRRHSSSRESGESAEKALFVWVLCLSYRILWRGGGVFDDGYVIIMSSKVGGPVDNLRSETGNPPCSRGRRCAENFPWPWRLQSLGDNFGNVVETCGNGIYIVDAYVEREGNYRGYIESQIHLQNLQKCS